MSQYDPQSHLDPYLQSNIFSNELRCAGVRRRLKSQPMLRQCGVWFFDIYSLFFFHSYGACGTRSDASHAQNAVISSYRNRFLSIWKISKILKFKNVDGANIHADTISVALVPINGNLYHRIYPSSVLIQTQVILILYVVCPFLHLLIPSVHNGRPRERWTTCARAPIGAISVR